MEDNLTDFQKKVQQGLKPVNLVLIFLEVVFLIFVAVTLVNILKEPEVMPEVGADVFSGSLEGVDDRLGEDIGTAVYDMVAMNTNGVQNIDKSEIVIRDGSLISKQFGDTGLRYVSFVVDIPELEQSYRVYYDDYDEVSEDDISGGAPEVLVACLSDSDEVVYKNFDCKDSYGDSIGYFIAREYEDLIGLGDAPGVGVYKVYLPGDKRVDGTTQDREYVEILSYCGDGSEEDAVKVVSDYFGELGLRLADFNYGVTNECEYYNEDEN